MARVRAAPPGPLDLFNLKKKTTRGIKNIYIEHMGIIKSTEKNSLKQMSTTKPNE